MDYRAFREDIISALKDKIAFRLEEKRKGMASAIFGSTIEEEFKVGQSVTVRDYSGQRLGPTGLAKILSIKGNKVKVNVGGSKPITVDIDQLSPVKWGKPE